LKIVVTGGAGFIGYHLTRALSKSGHSVVAYDNMSSVGAERIFDISDVELVEADVRDLASLRGACRGADAIFHLAAQVSVPFSMEEPSVDFDHNLRGMMNILETSRRVGARLFFASSAAVYGLPTMLPIPESHALEPISFYGLSKKSAELYCSMYSNTFGVPVTVFRLFNACGPHCHGVIYDVLHRLFENPTHLRVLGKPDGSKDFICVSDVTAAMLAALEHDPAESFEVFNLGSGTSTTIAALVSHLCNTVGMRPLVNFSGSSWPGDVTKGLCADTSKLFARFGWKPKTRLIDSLEKTVEWFRSVHMPRVDLKVEV